MSDEKDRVLDGYVMVFAGPNGSGKTSLIEEIERTGLSTFKGDYPLPARFINPDQVAKDLTGDFPDQNARDEAAQRTAMHIRAEATASKLPFAFETVMSHPSRINEMLLFKQQGYRLFLAFIATGDPEKNVDRVTLRYQTGTTTGHYVPPDKVGERYHRTLALLPRAAEIADAVYIYDNSIDFKKAGLQVVIERGETFSVIPNATEWVIAQLIQPLQRREREWRELAVALAKSAYPLGDTDELRGTYAGAVLSTSNYYMAQWNEASRQAVIHDRLMLETGRHDSGNTRLDYVQGEILTIRYSPTNAPEVERHDSSPDPAMPSASR